MKKLDEILFERRQTAEGIANKNLQFALSIPEFKTNYEKEKKLVIARAKANAYGKPFDETLLKTTQQNIDAILKKNNLTRADLTPNYTCKKCADTGYIFGKECECLKQLENELIMKENNLANLKTFADCNFKLFDNYDVEVFYNKMQTWAKQNEHSKNQVVLFGYSGTGKTFLMECLASEFLSKNKFIIFKTSYDLIKDCLEFHINKTKLDLLDKYFKCDVLFIDDLGSEPFYKNVSQEYLYQIIESRNRNKKLTIISTNLDTISLKDIYSERVFSRIANTENSIIFKFNKTDLRLKNNKK